MYMIVRVRVGVYDYVLVHVYTSVCLYVCVWVRGWPLVLSWVLPFYLCLWSVLV